MKKLLTLFLWSLAVLCVASENVQGWRDARWGMTPDQVIAALPGEAVRAGTDQFTDTNILVAIPSVQIERSKFKATFLFTPGTQRLKQIKLLSTPSNVDEFSMLEEKLTGKYGKPEIVSNDDRPQLASIDSTRRRVWNLGPTQIELKLWETLDNQTHHPIVSVCTIRYTEVPPSVEKNL
jgi:hypothetical protein